MVYLGIVLLCSALFLRVLVAFPNEICRQSHEVNVIKQIERMKTINEPKIIIIGGSGCGFGLCSKLISEHFNMPVCNTGTHAGLGLLTIAGEQGVDAEIPAYTEITLTLTQPMSVSFNY